MKKAIIIGSLAIAASIAAVGAYATRYNTTEFRFGVITTDHWTGAVEMCNQYRCETLRHVADASAVATVASAAPAQALPAQGSPSSAEATRGQQEARNRLLVESMLAARAARKPDPIAEEIYQATIHAPGYVCRADDLECIVDKSNCQAQDSKCILDAITRAATQGK